MLYKLSHPGAPIKEFSRSIQGYIYILIVLDSLQMCWQIPFLLVNVHNSSQQEMESIPPSLESELAL